MKQIWKVSLADFLSHFTQILKQRSFQFPDLAIAFVKFTFYDNNFFTSSFFLANFSSKNLQIERFFYDFYTSDFRTHFFSPNFLRLYFSPDSFTALPKRLSWQFTESALASQRRLSWQKTEFLTHKRLSWQPNELAIATHTRLSGHNPETSMFQFSHNENLWLCDQNFSNSFSCLFSWSDQRTSDLFQLCMGMDPSFDTPPFLVRTFLRFSDAVGTIIKQQKPNNYKLNPSHQLYSSIQR